MQQGYYRKNWKLRWLELRVTCMQYFHCQPPSPAKLKGTIPLGPDTAILGPKEVEDSVAWPKKSYGPANSVNCRFAVKTSGRTYYFVAPTADECSLWMEQLRKALQGPNPRQGSIVRWRRWHSSLSW